MSRHGLSEQVARLREQVDTLKMSLDQTLQSLDYLTARSDDLSRSAREIVAVVGEERPAPIPWGLILTLGLGAEIVWLVSPDTFSVLSDFFKAQLHYAARTNDQTAP